MSVDTPKKLSPRYKQKGSLEHSFGWLSITSDLTKKAEKIITRLRVAHPQAHCELYYCTPYQLLLSVILSAQATDKMVNLCMRPHYQAGLDPQAVLAWGYEGLLRNIRRIGLAPTKARNIIASTHKLLREHGGKIPDKRGELESFAGVGRKTANVILGEIYQQETLAVDTHVFRTTKRLGLHAEKNAEKCEQKLLQLIDKRFLPAAHHLFIAHGRYTCTARTPACQNCNLRDLCPSCFIANR